ncbi:MAG: MerR family transcriptional regulator [Pseudomonadota bacterium]|nr:MerR family transcriptional regulator [Pseudomonadota bacterium]
MFRIGEFAQVARVSGRQLRHYDRLGLLAPVRIDPTTGYRFYSATQLPRLNRILALKDLGFSLNQIARMLDDEVPPEELRAMLVIRKAQIEQLLTKEQLMLRQVESRILQIEEQGAMRDYDVSLRAEPSRPYLSVRQSGDGMEEAVRLLRMLVDFSCRGLSKRHRHRLTIVAHSDFDDEMLDLEFGFTLNSLVNKSVALPGGMELRLRELEAVENLATLVRSGPGDRSHLAYGALGVWMEANSYVIDGPCREVFLETPFVDPSREDMVMEIQFPVRKAA